MTENNQESNPETRRKEIESQNKKNTEYYSNSIKSFDKFWQVLGANYFSSQGFGESGKNIADAYMNMYLSTPDYLKQKNNLQSKLDQQNEGLYRPKRRIGDEEMLDNITKSAQATIIGASDVNLKSIDDLFNKEGFKDEKRTKLIAEIETIKNKSDEHYIQTGEDYKFTEEEKKIMDKQKELIGANWGLVNSMYAEKLHNEFVKSQIQGTYQKFYEETGLQKRDDDAKKAQEEQNQKNSN